MTEYALQTFGFCAVPFFLTTHLVLITLLPLASFRSTTSNTFHLLGVFLLFRFDLVDQSSWDASFPAVVSHHLLAFLAKAVFRHPVEVLAVQESSFLHGPLQTAADVVDIRDY